MAKTIRIADLLIDDTTGEVFREHDGGTQAVGRLAPQPAELLTLMVTLHPEVTTHEVIGGTLWPGVGGDFEQSMHFCMGKIRAALGDDASSPKYIETIPRRGYRFVEGIEVSMSAAAKGVSHIEEGSSRSAHNADATTEDRQAQRSIMDSPRWRWREWRIALATALVLALLLALPYAITKPKDEDPIRIAVMTFEPDEGTTSPVLRNDIAEFLVERLTNDSQIRMEIIGPTTTGAFAGTSEGLDALREKYDIDYLLNGRFSARRPGHLLLEIIRGRDGAHVWVQQVDLPTDTNATVDTMVNALLNTLSARPL